MALLSSVKNAVAVGTCCLVEMEAVVVVAAVDAVGGGGLEGAAG